MKARKLILFLGLVVLFVCAGGQIWAGGQNENAKGAAAAQPVTINVATSLGWITTDGLMPFLKDYLAKQGINVVAVPGQGVALRDKQMLAASSGDATYDVYLAWDALMPLLQKYGEPLDSYLQSAGVDVSGFEAKFYPNVVANASTDGKLYWVPIHINAQIGYARRDLFMDPNEQAAFKAKFGYDMPQPDSTGVLNFPTKKVFVDVAQFFTRTGSDGQTNLWGYVMAGKWDQGNTVFEEEMFRAGLGYFDQKGHSDWGPAETQNQPIVKDIATFDYNLVNTWKVCSPGVLGMELTEIGQLFATGKAAMSFTWNVDNWPLYKGTDFEKKYGLPLSWIPSFMDRSPNDKGLMSVWAWELNKNSKNKAAAVKFLLAAADENLRIQATQQAKLPVGNGMLDVSQWLVSHNVVPGAYIPAVQTIGTFWPTSPAFPQTDPARDVLRKAHEQLLTGQITPDQFVKQTGDGVEELMHQAGYF
jgi:multiple sugar transport system substrate-binding protein